MPSKEEVFAAWDAASAASHQVPRMTAPTVEGLITYLSAIVKEQPEAASFKIRMRNPYTTMTTPWKGVLAVSEDEGAVTLEPIHG